MGNYPRKHSAPVLAILLGNPQKYLRQVDIGRNSIAKFLELGEYIRLFLLCQTQAVRQTAEDQSSKPVDAFQNLGDVETSKSQPLGDPWRAKQGAENLYPMVMIRRRSYKDVVHQRVKSQLLRNGWDSTVFFGYMLRLYVPIKAVEKLLQEVARPFDVLGRGVPNRPNFISRILQLE